jgi:hypothetical protein
MYYCTYAIHSVIKIHDTQEEVRRGLGIRLEVIIRSQ